MKRKHGFAASEVVGEGAEASGAPACGSEASGPPNSNTGGGLTEGLGVGVDFLTGTFPLEMLPLVVAMVREHLGEPVDGVGLRWFMGGSKRWEEVGAAVAWSDSRGWLFLPGKALASLSAPMLFRLVNDLGHLGFKCTRVDLAIDDYSRQVIRMDDVHAAAAARNVVHFKRVDARRPLDMTTGELIGDTVYFGVRGKNGSGAFVRFYDKELESGGEVKCNRFEVEFCDERAALVFEILQDDSIEKFVASIGRLAIGAIDFRERRAEAHQHLDRMPRLPWWEKLVNEIGRARVVEKRLKPKLQKTAEWLKTTLKKTMGLIARKIDETGHDGAAWFAELVEEGRRLAEGWRVEAQIEFASLVGIHGERVAASEYLGVEGSPARSREYWAERNAEKLRWGPAGPTVPEGL